MQLNKNIKIILNYFLGPVVFLFLAYSIYHQLLKQPDWRQSWQQVKAALAGSDGWKIGPVILLMVGNWGLEAKKWQLAIQAVQSISFTKAFRATLTGTTMASFTPNRMGEYLGRILYIDDGKRIQAISLTIICSIAQLLITVIAGCLGILYFLYNDYWLAQPKNSAFSLFTIALLAVSLLMIIILTFFYFRLALLVKLLKRMKWSVRLFSALKVLEEFNAKVLLRILFLSFVRYLVFLAQYALLFSVFGVMLTWTQVAGGMSVVFLVMAVIPTFTFLTELGLRWGASIQVMTLFSANAVGIFATSFGIWLINLIIPALIGSLLILNIKLFRNK